MTELQIYSKINNLNPVFQQEVYDFIDYLLYKQQKEKEKKRPKFGCAKGRFKMSVDFDAPLDDLKEYME